MVYEYVPVQRPSSSQKEALLEMSFENLKKSAELGLQLQQVQARERRVENAGGAVLPRVDLSKRLLNTETPIPAGNPKD
jgi:hypothetical protein